MLLLVNADKNADLLDFLHRRGLVSRSSEVHTTCGWKGVTCEDGLVHSINWGIAQQFLRVQTDFFPSSVENIHLQNMLANSLCDFQVRYLPRELRYCMFFDCGLRGKLDLCELPAHIVSFDATSNFLHGTVNLTRLPDFLQHLFLKGNQIEAFFVNIDLLPRDIKEIHLKHRYEKVRCIPKSAVLDGRFKVN